MEETGQWLRSNDKKKKTTTRLPSVVYCSGSLTCVLSRPWLASYLITLRGYQQRPREVGIVKTVKLARRLHCLYMKAITSKNVDGISLVMVDR